MSIALRWIGGENRFVAGVPATDITVETEAEAVALCAGGLYERASVAQFDEQEDRARTEARYLAGKQARGSGAVSEESHDG